MNVWLISHNKFFVARADIENKQEVVKHCQHPKIIGVNFEQCRTQADFTAVAGTNEPTVSKIVRGRKPLDPSGVKKWAKLLGCEPREIFSRNQEKN